MVDKLSNFKWEKELYPPVDGMDEPPLERKWKATPAGFFGTILVAAGQHHTIG
jgi:hypothetical protein